MIYDICNVSLISLAYSMYSFFLLDVRPWFDSRIHTYLHTYIQRRVCVCLLVIYLRHVTAVVLFMAIDSIVFPWFDPVKP